MIRLEIDHLLMSYKQLKMLIYMHGILKLINISSQNNKMVLYRFCLVTTDIKNLNGINLLDNKEDKKTNQCKILKRSIKYG